MPCYELLVKMGFIGRLRLKMNGGFSPTISG